jgi:hypothetical protein
MASTEKAVASPEQRKRALLSAVALALMAVGIYAVVIVKFFVYK